MLLSKSDFKNYLILFSSSLALSLCVLSAPRVRATVLIPGFTGAGNLFHVVPTSGGSPASTQFSGNVVNVASVLNQFRAPGGPAATSGASGMLSFAPQSTSSAGFSVGSSAGSNFFDGVTQFNNLDPNFYYNCPLVTYNYGTDWEDFGDGNSGWTSVTPIVGLGNCGPSAGLGQSTGVLATQAVSNNRVNATSSVSIPAPTPTQVVRVITTSDLAPVGRPAVSAPVSAPNFGNIAF